MENNSEKNLMRIVGTQFVTSFASGDTYAAFVNPNPESSLDSQSGQGIKSNSVAAGGRGGKSEICVVGRSNVGKSSFINMLTGQKIAKTSSQPGRTRLINLFDVTCSGDDEHTGFVLVDLPGYGYAEAGKAQKQSWQSLADGYFQASKGLKQAFLLVDCRHDSVLDKQMLDYFYFYHLPFTVLASKCDKLKKSQLQKRISEIAAFFRIGRDNIIAVSQDGTGKSAVLARIQEVLSN